MAARYSIALLVSLSLFSAVSSANPTHIQLNYAIKTVPIVIAKIYQNAGYIWFETTDTIIEVVEQKSVKTEDGAEILHLLLDGLKYWVAGKVVPMPSE